MSDRTRRPVAPAESAPAVAAPSPTASAYMGEMDAGEREREDGSVAYGRALPDGNWVDTAVAGFDRMVAMAELSDRFDVVSDDFVGPRMPNQVTQSEMARIATMYSDIRRGTSNLNIDTAGMEPDEAAAFRDATMGDIGDLLTTNQGRELLDQLAYGQVDGRDETVTLGRAANPAAAGMDLAAGENAADMFNGTGVSTRLNYAAGVDVDMATLDPNWETSEYRNTSSDTVLFHELVHCLHYRDGVVQGDMVDGSADFNRVGDEARVPADRDVNLEEYDTVGLSESAGDLTENGYRAERSLVTGTPIPTRGEYSGSGPAPAPRAHRH